MCDSCNRTVPYAEYMCHLKVNLSFHIQKLYSFFWFLSAAGLSYTLWQLMKQGKLTSFWRTEKLEEWLAKMHYIFLKRYFPKLKYTHVDLNKETSCFIRVIHCQGNKEEIYPIIFNNLTNKFYSIKLLIKEANTKHKVDAYLATDIMEGSYSEIKQETEHSYPQPIQSAETRVVKIICVAISY